MTAGTGWESWKLAHAYHRIGSGTTPTSGNADYYDDETGTPWITTSELRETYIERTSNRVTQSALQDFTTLRTYKPNSVFMAMYGATIGRLGISTIPATCNQACCVFESSAKFDNRFLFYWLWHRRAELISLSVGGGQPNLSQQDLKSEKALCPPLETQKRIAAFLDEKTAQIDGLIARKHALLARLAEKRQAIITQAVTKGLNPAALLKDSGIDWLGQIPAHWEVIQLKRTVSLATSGPRGWSDLTADYGAIFFQSQNIGRAMAIELADAKRIDAPAGPDAERARLTSGDVVVCITGARTGAVAAVDALDEDCFINQHVCLLRPMPEIIVGRFLAFLLFSRISQEQLAVSIYGLKQGLGLEDVQAVALTLPTVIEQREVVFFLDEQVGRLAQLATATVASITRLTEYRFALITSAVTGQLEI